MPGTAARVGKRPRGFVGVVGPDAASYLQRMLSNDVEALGPDESCEALLLTAKGRIVAPMTVYRRSADDFLLLTEPELAERLRAELLRSRFAAKVTVELEEHESALVVGRETPAGGIANRELGVAAYEVIDEELPSWREIDDHELELLRIRAGRRASGASSTIASCRRRPGSTSERSTSRRAATRARSRSRASTTAAA